MYENDDDTSVVTMYLTVSKGNSSENTYHTWKEINSYSAVSYTHLTSVSPIAFISLYNISPVAVSAAEPAVR